MSNFYVSSKKTLELICKYLSLNFFCLHAVPHWENFLAKDFISPSIKWVNNIYSVLMLFHRVVLLSSRSFKDFPHS